MKQESSVIKEIGKIGDETYKKLKNLNVPPYPKYYHDTFMDLLYLTNDSELIDLSKRYSYLFNTGDNKEKVTETSLHIAKESIKEFRQSNDNIRSISDKSAVDLASLKEEISKVDTTNVLRSVKTFHERVAQELHLADEIILKLQKEIETLEKEATTDSLTKVNNRNALLRDLKELLEHKELTNTHFIFLDADNFKVINNNFGHIAGDKTLIYISKLLQNSLRQNTKIYRYGGEDFVAILTDVKYENALQITDRIIKEVNQSKLFYKGNNIHLTISAGITSFVQGDTPESLISRADKALKEAKDSGKNCFKEVKA